MLYFLWFCIFSIYFLSVSLFVFIFLSINLRFMNTDRLSCFICKTMFLRKISHIIGGKFTVGPNIFNYTYRYVQYIDNEIPIVSVYIADETTIDWQSDISFNVKLMKLRLCTIHSFRRALPALPISITFGLIFYFLTSEVSM